MATSEIRGKANFLGFERLQPDGSTRRDQRVVRGNGTVLLDSQALRFIRAVPHTEFVIPLEAVLGVSIGPSHNGKRAFFYPVVKVAFREEGAGRVIGLIFGRKREALRWAELIQGAVDQAP